jgi:hypothetical protein
MGCGARRSLSGSRRAPRRDGPSDTAGLGDPVQRAGAGWSRQHSSPGAPAKLNNEHKAFLARIVDEGPIPAIHSNHCRVLLRHTHRRRASKLVCREWCGASESPIPCFGILIDHAHL